MEKVALADFLLHLHVMTFKCHKQHELWITFVCTKRTYFQEALFSGKNIVQGSIVHFIKCTDMQPRIDRNEGIFFTHTTTLHTC